MLRSVLLSQHDGLLEQPKVELGRLDRVIVPWHGVRDNVGVAVRVHDGHGWYAHLCSVGNDAVVVVLCSHLGVQQDHGVWQSDLPSKDGLGRGEDARVPGPAVRKLSALAGRLLDEVHEVGLAGGEEDEAAAGGDVREEIQGLKLNIYCRRRRNIFRGMSYLSEHDGGLVEIDYGRVEPVPEDKLSHARIDRRGRVAEVHARVEQVLHREEFVHTEKVARFKRRQRRRHGGGQGHGFRRLGLLVSEPTRPRRRSWRPR